MSAQILQFRQPPKPVKARPYRLWLGANESYLVLGAMALGQVVLGFCGTLLASWVLR